MADRAGFKVVGVDVAGRAGLVSSRGSGGADAAGGARLNQRRHASQGIPSKHWPHCVLSFASVKHLAAHSMKTIKTTTTTRPMKPAIKRSLWHSHN